MSQQQRKGYQMKVYNLTNAKGNKVVNQFVIDNNETVHFQSYDSPIATFNRKTKILTLTDKWDYSVTTSKSLLQFIRENTFIRANSRKDISNLIASGEIKMA